MAGNYKRVTGFKRSSKAWNWSCAITIRASTALRLSSLPFLSILHRLLREQHQRCPGSHGSYWRTICNVSIRKKRYISKLNANCGSNSTVNQPIDLFHCFLISSVQRLAVILDYKGCCKSHGKCINATLACSIAVIGKPGQFWDHKSLHKPHYSLVLPYILHLCGDTG